MRTLVIAPHPDDELLGVGGTLLRRVSEGGTLAWLIMTTLTEETGGSTVQIQTRIEEIERVRKGLSVAPENFFQLGLPTTSLDTFAMSELIGMLATAFNEFQPDEVFLPHPGDIHSDHRVTFEAASACCKWFRHPYVKRIFAYETLSETDFVINPKQTFQPNSFVDISKHIEDKLDLLQVYASEMGDFPFPRSTTAVRALAECRGAQAGFRYAEAFQLLKERL